MGRPALPSVHCYLCTCDAHDQLEVYECVCLETNQRSCSYSITVINLWLECSSCPCAIRALPNSETITAMRGPCATMQPSCAPQDGMQRRMRRGHGAPARAAAGPPSPKREGKQSRPRLAAMCAAMQAAPKFCAPAQRMALACPYLLGQPSPWSTPARSVCDLALVRRAWMGPRTGTRMNAAWFCREELLPTQPCSTALFDPSSASARPPTAPPSSSSARAGGGRRGACS